MIKLGTSNMTKAYVGSTEISKVYLGSELVYTKKVLPYDRQIEYIQTDGSAYIDTGIKLGEITPILEVRMYLPSASSNSYVAGADGSGNTRFSIGRLTSNRIQFRVGNYGTTGSKPADWYVIKLNGSNGQCSLDGAVKWTSTTLTFNNNKILLFCRSTASGSAGTHEALAGVRLSECKIWDGDTLLQDLIPVRTEQVGYMYDKISKQLFGNAGSGAFVLGNDVN